jgi:hypothetical protein
LRCEIEDEIYCMPSPKTEQKILKKPPDVRNGKEEFWVLVVPDENGFFYKRNSKLCHTCINVIITSKEMQVPGAQHHP